MRKIWGTAAIVAALFLAPMAQASSLYIREYRSIAIVNSSQAQLAPEPGTDQAPVSFAGGTAASAAFSSTTKVVRLICDAACSILFGPAGSTTAAATNSYLPANTAEYFAVQGGQIVSVHSNP